MARVHGIDLHHVLEGDGAEPLPQEVNALYERLLQEMESKSEPLEQEIRMIGSRPAGRDY